MSEETIIITVKGVKHYFNGNELISPAREAMCFLEALALEEELF
tara:strand:+ start:2060 stop:2191 length:132 start_codon:yes stop_codon:yes gene_type:complete